MESTGCGTMRKRKEEGGKEAEIGKKAKERERGEGKQKWERKGGKMFVMQKIII